MLGVGSGVGPFVLAPELFAERNELSHQNVEDAPTESRSGPRRARTRDLERAEATALRASVFADHSDTHVRPLAAYSVMSQSSSA